MCLTLQRIWDALSRAALTGRDHRVRRRSVNGSIAGAVLPHATVPGEGVSGCQCADTLGGDRGA